MTMLDTIDGVRKWLEENVCTKLAFKKAPPPDYPAGKEYKHELVRPKAWAIYYPAGDVVKLLDYACPCVVVQPIEFNYLPDGGEEVKVRLAFMVWNTGDHIEDVYDLNDDTEPVFSAELGRFVQRSRYKLTNPEDAFKLNDDGWRDVFVFADTALLELKKAKNIGGFKLKEDEPINCTPYSEESVSQYFYPYHYTRLDITLYRSVIEAKDKEVEEYL